jgi:hypothetical protein
MKIRSVGADLFHAGELVGWPTDGQTRDEANIRLSQFCERA